MKTLPLSTHPILLGALLFSLLPPALLAEAEDKAERKFAVQPGAKLLVDVDRGNVTVSPGEGNEVNVQVTRKLPKVSDAEAAELLKKHQVTFSHEAGAVNVRAQMTEKPTGNSKLNRLQASYEITVPKDFNVNLKTGGGSVTVGDLKGEIVADTSAGNIKVGNITGPVQAKTRGGSIKVAQADTVKAHTSAGNIDLGEIIHDADAETRGGSIQIDKPGGKATAQTSAGNIRIGEVAGDLLADTRGGSIKIKNAAGKLLAKTSAGNIDISQTGKTVDASTRGGSITATLAGTGDAKLKTSAGNITVSVPPKGAFDLAATSSAGSVTCDLDISAIEKKRSSLIGKINGGGAPLVLHTSGGSVHIKKAPTLAAERE